MFLLEIGPRQANFLILVQMLLIWVDHQVGLNPLFALVWDRHLSPQALLQIEVRLRLMLMWLALCQTCQGKVQLLLLFASSQVLCIM